MIARRRARLAASVLAASALAACNADHAPSQAAGPTAPAPPASPTTTASAVQPAAAQPAPAAPPAPSAPAPSPSAPAAPAPAAPAAPANSAAAPPDGQRCLPVNVCDEWSGCGLVAPAPRFWKVIAADRFAPGDIVDVTSVCTSGDTCTAIRGIPKGVQCRPWTTPIYIKPPDYRCVWDGKTCHRA